MYSEAESSLHGPRLIEFASIETLFMIVFLPSDFRSITQTHTPSLSLSMYTLTINILLSLSLPLYSICQFLYTLSPNVYSLNIGILFLSQCISLSV